MGISFQHKNIRSDSKPLRAPRISESENIPAMKDKAGLVAMNGTDKSAVAIISPPNSHIKSARYILC